MEILLLIIILIQIWRTRKLFLNPPLMFTMDIQDKVKLQQNLYLKQKCLSVRLIEIYNF